MLLPNFKCGFTVLSSMPTPDLVVLAAEKRLHHRQARNDYGQNENWSIPTSLIDEGFSNCASRSSEYRRYRQSRWSLDPSASSGTRSCRVAVLGSARRLRRGPTRHRPPILWNYRCWRDIPSITASRRSRGRESLVGHRIRGPDSCRRVKYKYIYSTRSLVLMLLKHYL